MPVDGIYYAIHLMKKALGQYGIGGRLGDSIRDGREWSNSLRSFDANVIEDACGAGRWNPAN